MRQFTRKPELHAHTQSWRDQGQVIAFVPTMGNLHAGHLSLIKKAATLADRVLVSIFVNPLQFDDARDLERYPRTLDADLQALHDTACDAVFLPDETLIYPDGMAAHSRIHVPGSDDRLCGAGRPGHFDGVATVVTKLLLLVQPDIAVFGEKDFQQLWLIRKLVRDLHLPVTIASAPTVREDSGLAMSSRNQHLSEAHHQQAQQIYQQLQWLHDQILAGRRDFAQLCARASENLEQAGLSVEYLEVREASTLSPATAADSELRLMVAARAGETRLIDNIPVALPEQA